MSRSKFIYNVKFSLAIETLMKIAGVGTYKELAEFLGIGSSSVTNAKIKDKIPWTWLIITAKKTGVSMDDLDKMLLVSSPDNGHNGYGEKPQTKKTISEKPTPEAALFSAVTRTEDRRHRPDLREAINRIMASQNARGIVRDLLLSPSVDVGMAMIRRFIINQSYLKQSP